MFLPHHVYILFPSQTKFLIKTCMYYTHTHTHTHIVITVINWHITVSNPTMYCVGSFSNYASAENQNFFEKIREFVLQCSGSRKVNESIEVYSRTRKINARNGAY